MTEKFLPKLGPVSTRSFVPDGGISGKPFHTVEDAKAEVLGETVANPTVFGHQAVGRESAENLPYQGDQSPQRSKLEDRKITLTEIRAVEVPVGISRLHMTSLPALQMKPLYWSPVNDIAIVTRATWFYRYVSILGLEIGRSPLCVLYVRTIPPSVSHPSAVIVLAVGETSRCYPQYSH